MVEAGESKLAKCALHGLHFDPSVQVGCVVCRRSSAPPSPSSSGAPVAPGEPAPGGASAGWGALVVLRFGITALLLVMVALFQRADDPGHALSNMVGAALVPVFFGAVPLAFSRFRSLQGASYTFLFAALIELLWRGQDYSQHHAVNATQFVKADTDSAANAPSSVVPTDDPNALVFRPSKDGVILVRVPASWQSEESVGGSALKLKSPDGSVVLFNANEPAARLDPFLNISQYLEIEEGRAAEALSATYGASKTAIVAGVPGLVAPMQGSMLGVSFSGFIYAARGPTHFHVFRVLYPSTRRDRDVATAQSCVEHAVIRIPK